MPLFNFIKSKLSILDIVSEYVQLKPMGNYHKGPCPFHSEKDASFTVSPDKQIFYCFGCQAGGDTISFVAKIENLTQLEAVNFLIDKYKIDIPEEIQKGNLKKLHQQKGEKEKYFHLCEAIADYSNKKLLSNATAKEYVNKRGIDLKNIKYFNIGYFAGGVRFINNFIKDMAQQGILVKDLVSFGILMEGKNVLYSPFEERILFPIKDKIGRYLGFGGRIFKESDQRAKYYNSKENDFFSKGTLLFGLDLAKKEMQKKSQAFLVEGYTDCVAMIKHGYLNTVATLGTACTKDHLKELSRYITKLYVLYDGDQAGQKAILRLTQLCWDVNLELQIIKLPIEHDPASFLEENGNLKPLIESSVNIFTFFVESLGGNFFKSSLSEKLELSKKIIEMIVKINDPFKQELLVQRASTVMQVPIESIKKLFFKQKANGSSTNASQKSPKNATKSSMIPLLEERIFSAIINNMGKNSVFSLEADLIPYFSDKIQILLKKLQDFNAETDDESLCFEKYLEKLDEKDRNWVIACSLKFEEPASQELFEQLIFHFCKKNWRQIVQDMKMKLLKAKQSNNTEELKKLFIRFSGLKQGMQNRGLI